MILQENLLVACTLLLFYWLWSRRHFYRFAFEQPGFWGYPLVGCINRISRIEDSVRAFEDVFKELKKHYALLWMGPYPMFVLSDPDLIGKVLVSPNCINKASFLTNAIANMLSDGLITMSGDTWRRHRKLLSPSFRQRVLLSFSNVFNQELQSIISEFHKLSEGKSESGAFEIIRRYARNAIIKTTMGQKIENYDEVNVILGIGDKGIETTRKFLMLTAWKLSWLFRFDFGFQKTIRNYHSYTRNIVKQRLESHSEGKNHLSDLDDDSISIRRPARIFIDEAAHLVESKQLTLREMEGHVNHIISGGFLTVTDAIFHGLLLLAMHPDKQQRLYEEILELAPEKTGEISIETLKSFPYLDKVVNETLRLMPPVPFVARECSADTQLSGDITVPKGTLILINLFHLHRNKEVWGDDVEHFKPERFDSEAIKDLHPYAFLPFNKSLRDCVGKQYADYFVKIMLIGLVRNFRFSTQFKYEDLEFICTVNIGLKVTPQLLIERRCENILDFTLRSLYSQTLNVNPKIS